MTIFSIFGFLAEFAFMGKFGPKNQNRQFSLKYVTYSVSDQKHSFWANLVLKIKIACLSLNLVPILI